MITFYPLQKIIQDPIKLNHSFACVLTVIYPPLFVQDHYIKGQLLDLEHLGESILELDLKVLIELFD